MKRLAVFLLVFIALSVSCQPLTTPTIEVTPIPPTQASTITSIPPTQAPLMIADMKERLKELGGTPCRLNTLLTCVTITVPLNHFDPSNSETIDVVFGVAPARGKRKGMYVQAAPGGPGGEGITTAWLAGLPPEVREQYDIVYYDQRGIGLSNPLECKNAFSSYFLNFLNTDDSIGEEGFDTPEERETATQNAKSFVDACVTEIGIDPAKLQFFITDQVAEDIESFRQVIGDEKFMLYGVSYGTSVAQAYARAHSDHLSGLILNGTQDTTLTGNEIAFSQMDAFNLVLLEVFKACDADADCSKGFEGRSQDAYDELAQKLANAPIDYDFPLSGGESVKRSFTLNMLDFTTYFQLYSPESRMELMHALASAQAGDMLPLVRIYYKDTTIDTRSQKFKGNPNFSDTMYYIIWCSDDAYYSGTSEERSASLFQEGQRLIGLDPRVELDVFMLGLTCAFWPSAPTSPEVRQPLKAEGVPTFILNATLDPATPFLEGKTVFENLDNGYHLYVEGGYHGILARGFDCPDQYIEDFLLNGSLPEQREIVCDWGESVIH
jgi:pimeloyl-ACP methyl ester carboxylesterase